MVSGSDDANHRGFNVNSSHQLFLSQRTTRITGRRELTRISQFAGHRRSRACDGSSKPLSRRVFVEFIVSGRCSVWQWWLVNLSVGERRWMLHTISLTERLDHGFIRKRSSSE